MTRRTLVLVFSVVIGLIVIGGLGYFGYRTFLGGKGTLTVWTIAGQETALAESAKVYHQKFPSYKVKIVPIPEQALEFKTLYALSAHKGPEIWVLPNEWMALHQSKLVAAPDGSLDTGIQSYKRSRAKTETPPPWPAKGRTNVQVIDQDYGPIVKNDVEKNGQVYGVPLNMDTLALFYDHTKINVAPKTWNEVIEATKRFTQKSGSTITRSTIALGERNTVDHSLDILSILFLQNGVQMVDPKANIATFNVTPTSTPAGPNTLDFYTSFARSDKATYTWNNSFGGSISALKKGQTLMAVGYLNDLNTLGPIGSTNIAVAPLPQVDPAKPQTYGRSLVAGVTKQADTPDKVKAAWNFVSLLANPDVSEAYATSLRAVPARKDVAARLSLGAQYKPFLDQVSQATDWPKAEVSQADDAFDQSLSLVLDKNTPPAIALDVAAKQYTVFLQQDTGMVTDPAVMNLWQSDDDTTDYKLVASTFLAQNKPIKRVAISHRPADRFEWESLNAMASRLGPDILAVRNDSVHRFAPLLHAFPANSFNLSNKRYDDLTAYQREYIPAVVTDNWDNGKLYGMPANVETLMYAYNADLFRQLATAKGSAGDQAFFANEELFNVGPLLWDDLKVMAQIGTKHTGDKIDQAFVSMGTGANVAHGADLYAVLVKQFGGQVTEPDGLRTGINLPFSSNNTTIAGKEALDLLKSFGSSSSANYSWNLTYDNSLNALAKGQVMSAFIYPRDVPKIMALSPQINLRFFPLPQMAKTGDAVDFASYYSLTIPQSAKRANDAYHFIQLALSADTSENFISPKRQVEDVAIVDRPGRGNTQQLQKNSAQSYFKGLFPDEIDATLVSLLDSRLSLDQAAGRINQFLKQPIL